MPSIDLVVETAVSRSARARQLEAMFDVPPAEKCRLSWTGALPIGADYPGDWNVGLIVGPSGSGKTSIARRMHTYPAHPSLIRSFDHSRNWKMEKRAGVFSPPTSTQRGVRPETGGVGFGKHNMGKASRPCAVFEYCGEADAQAAELLQ